LSACFFFQAEDGIRDATVTGVQTCALPICWRRGAAWWTRWCSARSRVRTRSRKRSHSYAPPHPADERGDEDEPGRDQHDRRRPRRPQPPHISARDRQRLQQRALQQWTEHESEDERRRIVAEPAPRPADDPGRHTDPHLKEDV